MPQERYMANPSVSFLRTPDGAALLNPDTGERASTSSEGESRDLLRSFACT